jgi:hypothetical protein
MRQSGIVEGRIADDVLFPSVAIALQGRMDVLLKETKAKCTSILAQAVQDVGTDLRFVLALQSETLQGDDGLEAASEGVVREIAERLRLLKGRAEDVRRTAAE